MATRAQRKAAAASAYTAKLKRESKPVVVTRPKPKTAPVVRQPTVGGGRAAPAPKPAAKPAFVPTQAQVKIFEKFLPPGIKKTVDTKKATDIIRAKTTTVAVKAPDTTIPSSITKAPVISSKTQQAFVKMITTGPLGQTKLGKAMIEKMVAASGAPEPGGPPVVRGGPPPIVSKYNLTTKDYDQGNQTTTVSWNPAFPTQRENESQTDFNTRATQYVIQNENINIINRANEITWKQNQSMNITWEDKTGQIHTVGSNVNNYNNLQSDINSRGGRVIKIVGQAGQGIVFQQPTTEEWNDAVQRATGISYRTIVREGAGAPTFEGISPTLSKPRDLTLGEQFGMVFKTAEIIGKHEAVELGATVGAFPEYTEHILQTQFGVGTVTPKGYLKPEFLPGGEKYIAFFDPKKPFAHTEGLKEAWAEGRAGAKKDILTGDWVSYTGRLLANPIITAGFTAGLGAGTTLITQSVRGGTTAALLPTINLGKIGAVGGQAVTYGQLVEVGIGAGFVVPMVPGLIESARQGTLGQTLAHIAFQTPTMIGGFQLGKEWAQVHQPQVMEFYTSKIKTPLSKIKPGAKGYLTDVVGAAKETGAGIKFKTTSGLYKTLGETGAKKVIDFTSDLGTSAKLKYGTTRYGVGKDIISIKTGTRDIFIDVSTAKQFGYAKAKYGAGQKILGAKDVLSDIGADLRVKYGPTKYRAGQKILGIKEFIGDVSADVGFKYGKAKYRAGQKILGAKDILSDIGADLRIKYDPMKYKAQEFLGESRLKAQYEIKKLLYGEKQFTKSYIQTAKKQFPQIEFFEKKLGGFQKRQVQFIKDPAHKVTLRPRQDPFFDKAFTELKQDKPYVGGRYKASKFAEAKAKKQYIGSRDKVSEFQIKRLKRQKLVPEIDEPISDIYFSGEEISREIQYGKKYGPSIRDYAAWKRQQLPSEYEQFWLNKIATLDKDLQIRSAGIKLGKGKAFFSDKPGVFKVQIDKSLIGKKQYRLMGEKPVSKVWSKVEDVGIIKRKVTGKPSKEILLPDIDESLIGSKPYRRVPYERIKPSTPVKEIYGRYAFSKSGDVLKSDALHKVPTDFKRTSLNIFKRTKEVGVGKDLVALQKTTKVKPSTKIIKTSKLDRPIEEYEWYQSPSKETSYTKAIGIKKGITKRTAYGASLPKYPGGASYPRVTDGWAIATGVATLSDFDFEEEMIISGYWKGKAPTAPWKTVAPKIDIISLTGKTKRTTVRSEIKATTVFTPTIEVTVGKKYDIKPGEISGIKIDIGELGGVKTDTKTDLTHFTIYDVRTDLDVGTKLSQRFKLDLALVQKQALIQKTVLEIKLKQKTKLIPEQEPMDGYYVTPELVGPGMPEESPLIKPRTPRITPRIPKIKIPLIPFFGDEGGKAKREKRVVKAKGDGFNVYVKERSMFRGKIVKGTRFKQMNKEALSRKAALALGGSTADNTAAISFKIKPTKQKPTKLTKRVKPWDDIKHKFTKKGNVYIEQNPYRIDTKGEVREITKRGQRSQKRISTSKKLFVKKSNILKKKKGEKDVRFI